MKLVLLAAALAALALPAAAQNCKEDQTLFVHDMIVGGEACIPADPQRLLFSGDVGAIAISLGAEPVGVDRYFEMFADIYPGVLDLPWTAEATRVGFLPRDDLETVATVAPDLIVSESYWPDLNENLAKIAPTVVIDTDAATAWLVRQEVAAAILGREEESARQIKALEARLARVRDRLGDDPPTFAVIQPSHDEGRVKIHTSGGIGFATMEAAGLVRAPGVLSQDEAVARFGTPWDYDISPERIDDVAADFVFVIRAYDDDIHAAMLDSPLWQASRALAEADLVEVPGTPRPFIGEYLPNAHFVIDLVYEQVLGLDPQEVDPNPFADWLPQN